MNPENRFPGRPPRIVLFQDVRPFYFVTFTTHQRRHGLTCQSVHQALRDYGLCGHAEQGVALGRYVLMPDHVHLFVVLPEPGPTLSVWVRGLKRALGVALKAEGSRQPFWQEGFFDHVLRNGESYSEKWAYVRENPVRAGLCDKAEDWPWQGEIVPIRF
jgi:putative transposase